MATRKERETLLRQRLMNKVPVKKTIATQLVTAAKSTRIDHFAGPYEFLNPDFPCEVHLLLDDNMRIYTGNSPATGSSSAKPGHPSHDYKESGEGMDGDENTTAGGTLPTDNYKFRRFPCAAAAIFQVQFGPKIRLFLKDREEEDDMRTTGFPKRQDWEDRLEQPEWIKNYEDNYPESGEEMRKTFQDDLKWIPIDDWNDIRLQIVDRVLRDKFLRNLDFRRQLIETGERSLMWENDCFDIFFGTVNGTGQNHLGRMMQEIRSILVTDEKKSVASISALDSQYFREYCYKCLVPEDRRLVRPYIVLDEIKGDNLEKKHELDTTSQDLGKYQFFIGRDKCDIIPAHPSTSRRHALIFCSKAGVGIMDLQSKSGVTVNGKKLKHLQFYLLKSNDSIIIGESTRYYKVVFDDERNAEILWREQRELMQEVALETGQSNGDMGNSIYDEALARAEAESTVFVGGLSHEVTRRDLMVMFAEFGEITKIKLPQDPGSKGAPDAKNAAEAGANLSDLDMKATRGFGFIVFKSPEMARRSTMQLDGHTTKEIGNRILPAPIKLGVRLTDGGKGKGKKGKGKKGGDGKGKGKDVDGVQRGWDTGKGYKGDGENAVVANRIVQHTVNSNIGYDLRAERSPKKQLRDQGTLDQAQPKAHPTSGDASSPKKSKRLKWDDSGSQEFDVSEDSAAKRRKFEEECKSIPVQPIPVGDIEPVDMDIKETSNFKEDSRSDLKEKSKDVLKATDDSEDDEKPKKKEYDDSDDSDNENDTVAKKLAKKEKKRAKKEKRKEKKKLKKAKKKEKKKAKKEAKKAKKEDEKKKKKDSSSESEDESDSSDSD